MLQVYNKVIVLYVYIHMCMCVYIYVYFFRFFSFSTVLLFLEYVRGYFAFFKVMGAGNFTQYSLLIYIEKESEKE